jgi:hypothetical protein
MNFPSDLSYPPSWNTPESWSAEKMDKFNEFIYEKSGLYEQSGCLGGYDGDGIYATISDEKFIHETIQGRNLLSALNKYISPPSYSKEHFIESKNEVKLLVKDSMYAEDVYFKHTTKHIFNDPILFEQVYDLDLSVRKLHTTKLYSQYSLSHYLESRYATTQQLLEMFDEALLMQTWATSECNKLHSILARKHNLSILRKPRILSTGFDDRLQTFIENNTKWRFV